MISGPFAFVRNLQTSGGSNLKDFAQITSAEAHAKRLDKTSKARKRPGGDHSANYFWSRVGQGLEAGGADYAAAYKAHKKAMGITSERKGAAIGQHLLVGVSPEWLAEAGDPHDLNNPRVKELIEQAKSWAESWMGKGAVWAVRYDTDEKGSGVVDILASPVRTAHHKSGHSKPSISVRKANAELAEKWDSPNAFQAMQDDWAAWASQRLSARLQRGIPQKDTKREHLTPEAYAEALSAAPEVQDARAEAARILSEAQAERDRLLLDAQKTIKAAQSPNPTAEELSYLLNGIAAMQIAEKQHRTLGEARRQELARTAEQVEENKKQAAALLNTDAQLRQWTSFVDFMRAKVKLLFGDAAYERLAAVVNTEWAKHPDNLTKPPHQPAPPKPPEGSGNRSR